MRVQDMISTHPDVRGSTADRLLRCVEACYECAQTCVSCADACVAEEAVSQLKQCIRLNLDCADICATTGAMATRRAGRNVGVLRHVIDACAHACRVCAEECERHGGQHDHCRICAEVCRNCEMACQEALAEVH